MSLFGRTGPGGYPPIAFASGVAYTSQFYTNTSNPTATTTATRLVYTPFYVASAITFTRVYTFNQSAGQNGLKYRTGVYADSSSKPGSLILDFGEVTLTAAAALRTQTISLDLSAYVGKIIWLAVHTESSTNLYGYTTQISGAEGYFGAVSSTAFTGGVSRYVDTAYGALASTAVAATANPSSADVPKLLLGTP